MNQDSNCLHHQESALAVALYLGIITFLNLFRQINCFSKGIKLQPIHRIYNIQLFIIMQ